MIRVTPILVTWVVLMVKPAPLEIATAELVLVTRGIYVNLDFVVSVRN